MDEYKPKVLTKEKGEILANAALLLRSALHNEPHSRDEFVHAFIVAVVTAEEAEDPASEYYQLSQDAVAAAHAIDMRLSGAIAQ